MEVSVMIARIISISFFLAASCHVIANAGESPNTKPLNLEKNTPEMIAESSWSEGDDVIIERTFTVLDEGHAITLKRRYKEITEEKMQLIWRSAETIQADARFCAYSQRLPMNDDDTLIIYKNNGYTSICHGHPTIEKPDENHDSEAGLIQPQDVVVGDQYYRFADGSTTVLAGTRSTAHATGYYGVRGVGQVTLEFYSDAASCGATNVSNINSPNALIENDIRSSLVCRVTDVPGYYAFHIEGCALGPPLCDSQDYVTTVVD